MNDSTTVAHPQYLEWVDRLVEEYANWFKALTWQERRYNEEYKELPFYELLSNANQEEERMWIMAMVEWLKTKGSQHMQSRFIHEIFFELLSTKRSFKHDEVVGLINYFAHMPYRYTEIIRILKHHLKSNELTPGIQDAIRVLVEIAEGYSDATIARQATTLAELGKINAQKIRIKPGEAWEIRR